MGYLEKVFLGTLLLFTLVIIFMFGLYFDVGTMLQSAMKKTDGASSGSAGRSLDQVERSSVASEVTNREAPRVPAARPVSRMSSSDAEANFEAVYARISQVKPPPTIDEKMDRKRKQLSSQGYGADFIEMEVRAMDERELKEAIAEVEQLIARGSIDEAEKVLLAKIDALDKRDLITLQRYRMKLQALYFDSNQFDKYKDAMMELFDTEERILSIQASSKMMEDKHNAEAIKLKKEDLEKKRAEFDQYYEQVSQQAAANGGVLKLNDAQVTEIKAGLLREQEAGRIRPEDLQAALAQLEQASGGSR